MCANVFLLDFELPGVQWLSKALPGCVFNKGSQIEAPSSDWSNCHYHSWWPVGEQWNSAEQKTIEAIFIITDWHFIRSGSRQRSTIHQWQRMGHCLLLLHILSSITLHGFVLDFPVVFFAPSTQMSSYIKVSPDDHKLYQSNEEEQEGQGYTDLITI